MCMWQTILAICGGIAAVSGGIVGLKKIFEPYIELRKEINLLKEHEKNDLARFSNIEESIQRANEERQKEIDRSDQFRQTMYEALFALVNHEIDGNGIDGMKTIRNTLQDHIFKGEV